MNIINIGILAHVDAGKTTLTESLLYASGTISEPGSVEKGTTRTDTMFLERQRGITIQTAVTSFQWHSCKVNIVDTPGHMDFLAEVYRSLAVLDGAILVLSAKDGVQAQTRVLFHALRKLNIPTIIFINKIDQVGIDLESVYQSVRDKLSADIIIKQTVSLSSKITLTENTSAEVWDSVIENNDELLAKYIAGESISQKELAQEEQRRVQDASLLPVYHGSAKNGLGIQQLMDAVIGLFQSTKEQGSAALCGRVFKVEYTDCGQRLVYLRLYSGTLRLRDTVALAGREKLKITEMRIPSKGEIVRTDTAHTIYWGTKPNFLVKCGVMFPSLCCGRRLRQKRQSKETGCWTLLRKLRILTRFCTTRWIPPPMRSFFLFWVGCSWRLFPLC